jgi:hypothetical protein
MGTARHVDQHASCIIEVFWLTENFTIDIHRGVGCNDHNIVFSISLRDDMGLALRKALHVCEWSFVNERSFVNVSRLNVKRHFAFAE